MRSPAALLLVTPLLACFADGGSTTFVTAAGSSSSTGESTQPVTGSETSSAATSTTDAPTTGAVDNCLLAPECAVGDVEDGAQCDSCGVSRRTCQADCTWSPFTCQQDLDTCAYWVLPADQKVWQRVAVDPAADLAPKDTVLAAIALEPQQQIFVLTANTYHVLSTVNRSWTAAGQHNALFPELDGQPLHHATVITYKSSDTIAIILAGTTTFNYTFVADKKQFVFDGAGPCCGDDWIGANAPPSPYVIRDSWARRGDPQGWIQGDHQALCDLNPDEPFDGYSAAIGDGFVYPQDIGYCFDFYPPIPFDQFGPFAYPGRPANDLIGGAGWVDGVWIFRGQ